MTNYNQTNLNGSPMPLLMGFTQPTPIREATSQSKIYYDPVTQTTVMEMGVGGFLKHLIFTDTIGTESLRHNGTTNKKNGRIANNDAQNCIDDSKPIRN